MATTLLRTKLYIPRPTRSLVPRQALVQRLEAGLDRDLTLVVAPVGYGKTTLVATWAAQAALPIAWLTLNENDNDLFVFISYLLAAIRTLAPAACPQTQSLLENERLPEVDLLATFLINEIDDLPQRFVLVLDDYHLIQAPAVHQLLEASCATRLCNCICSSPAGPIRRLPCPDCALRNGCTSCGSKICAFPQPKPSHFWRRQSIWPDRAHAMQVLTARAEGWIAGLQLAALSLRMAADQAAVLRYLERGVDRYIMDYLFEQVLNQQPPAVQTFLLKTSILEQTSPALAQAVVAEDGDLLGVQVSLAGLERAGIFVNALDNSGEWYGYHALFRELLRHHLQIRTTKAQIAELHRRASTWFCLAGLIDEALHHALAAEDIGLAAQIIVDHFATWLDREKWPAIERWLGLLPAAAFIAIPGCWWPRPTLPSCSPTTAPCCRCWKRPKRALPTPSTLPHRPAKLCYAATWICCGRFIGCWPTSRNRRLPRQSMPCSALPPGASLCARDGARRAHHGAASLRPGRRRREASAG